jgi:hypothetical protein
MAAKNLQFKIEQVAICPPNKEAALRFMAELGIDPGAWVFDHVVATGQVFGEPGTNEADLNFNYDLLSEAKEFEILDYTTGANWMEVRGPSVSHLGMHVDAEELSLWRDKMISLEIEIAQEVFTESHTNPAIAGKRLYEYVIFDTHHILGVDLKFIRRRNVE